MRLNEIAFFNDTLNRYRSDAERYEKICRELKRVLDLGIHNSVSYSPSEDVTIVVSSIDRPKELTADEYVRVRHTYLTELIALQQEYESIHGLTPQPNVQSERLEQYVFAKAIVYYYKLPEKYSDNSTAPKPKQLAKYYCDQLGLNIRNAKDELTTSDSLAASIRSIKEKKVSRDITNTTAFRIITALPKFDA